MKQETLEEVAHKMLDDYGIKSMGQSIGVLEVKKLMVKMAKWQAERMYSEEEIRKAIQLARLCTLDNVTGEFVDLSGLTEVCTYGLEETHSEDSIIEQFKNK
jgi:hypothetical protein